MVKLSTNTLHLASDGQVGSDRSGSDGHLTPLMLTLISTSFTSLHF